MKNTLGVMQPYFFPYLGYWQLLNAVDHFVIYDDVQYIKGGYINRNYILLQNKRHTITLQLQGASSSKMINDIMTGSNHKKLLKTIEQAYTKAPFFNQVFPVIEDCLNYDTKNLAELLTYSILNISNYLEIESHFHRSSEINKDLGLDRTERLYFFCQHLNCDRYINAIGGQHLYNKEEFLSQNIELRFIKKEPCAYIQFNSNNFEDNLSIIDVMMFNDRKSIQSLLTSYSLI